jgi:O-succinylbenzoate synthase
MKADAAKAQAAAMTLAQVADIYIAAHEANSRHPKHRQQWHRSLEQYVLPGIGKLPVGVIETGHITRIIEPMWQAKTETATRVRERIEGRAGLRQNARLAQRRKPGALEGSS